ncbi:MAG: GNAT family N-acetyltransferase [Defluviitaleaceae bacterium]|nr:GNAT family N-acetyltransferase [Defluviitaleaceae bacterium]
MERYKRYVGEKVYLTALELRDAEEITKWHNDPDVAVFLRDFREMKSLLTIQDEVTEMIKSGEAFAIFDAATDKLIGNSRGCSIMLGDKNYWHKGYDLEALEFLKHFCFNVRNENVVDVSVFSHDTRALACYEAAGFKRCVVYRQRLIRGRERYDEIHLDMLASEYFAMQNKEE